MNMNTKEKAIERKLLMFLNKYSINTTVNVKRRYSKTSMDKRSER
jgi:hypothetical protein